MQASVWRAPSLLPSKPRLAAAPPQQRGIGAAGPSTHLLRCPPVAANLSDVINWTTSGLMVALVWQDRWLAQKKAQLEARLAALEAAAEKEREAAALPQRRMEQGNGGNDSEAA
ncbi:ADP-ribosylation factor GTPase-activating 3 [Chlorella sorokiniana]|uniref:ADP-ribosylation factor GTPase-activating 3 n=1 Tax=Chlorella sorokiniana TaxID=3076 RepID=A0A2P6TXJ6_CHLSO|nr:ADP-ribosylation factor GTPase-activating 3 [Chlorella sorokiniana]|eukprot:PRW58783.1 ADP-ribosylation factor GTPase-activating 3 [Chlorella sorokiniana]